MTTDPYLDWPAEVSIETYTKCNAACSFCPYTELPRIGTKMPDEMIDGIIAELKHHPHSFIISPFKVSEFLLDKRAIPICQKINAELPNAYIRLFSNGSTLTEKNVRAIAGLDRVYHLWVSLNEHEPDAYHKLMGLSFERTVTNLDRLHDIGVRGEFPSEVVVSKVRELNERDDAFCKFVAERWPYFRIHLIKRDAWIDYISAERDEVPDESCGRWWELNIRADGKVSLCCMDSGLTEEYTIGDLAEQSLFEVYNQRAQRERRLENLSRRATCEPCNRCTY